MRPKSGRSAKSLPRANPQMERSSPARVKASQPTRRAHPRSERSARRSRKKRTTGRPPPSRPSKRRSEEHTSELQSLMRSSYAVFCLKKKNIEKENDAHEKHAQ